MSRAGCAVLVFGMVRGAPGDRGAYSVRRDRAGIGGKRRASQRQKPSMQTSEAAQVFPCVGSHSVPRFASEPHTEWDSVPVVTVLQTLNVSALLHESGTAISQEM